MAFRGTKVFLSRSLLPPELIDSLQDVLKQNGAHVCLCCDPSCNAPNEFHVLFSPDSDKFAGLQANRCQVVGPECVFRCAEERKPLPKRKYTCCFAMEGVKVLATGFNSQEKLKIDQLVTSMCGIVETNAISSLNFVIAKNVLASKYKLACSLRKPIVTFSWLSQCSHEHRIVPYETYKLPIFAGLRICATQILSDTRTKIAEAAGQNAGCYSADLTRDCTHLIANTPDGDKYNVAKKWGTVKLVDQQWLWQSLSMKMCLDEELFPVLARVTDRNPQPNPEDFVADDMKGLTNPSTCSEEVHNGHVAISTVVPQAQTADERTIMKPYVGDDFYLADCIFYIVGFGMVDKKRLVNMILDGGGTRYMEFNKTVTHVILGRPSESELKEVQQAAMWGAIHVVSSVWLEECAQQRREISVTSKHIPINLSTPQEKIKSGLYERPQKPGRAHSLNVNANDRQGEYLTSGEQRSFHYKGEHVAAKSSTASLNSKETQSHDASAKAFSKTDHVPAVEKRSARGVFYARSFGFLDTFPIGKRDEVIKWVTDGGGSMEDKPRDVDYLIGNHGSSQTAQTRANVKVVSTHWIRYCLVEEKILDINDHVLYHPLSCRVPLPGFETFKLCISQYEEKDRILCRNLCHVLGAKFTELLNKKVTHLLCKVSEGEKYKAAVSWGIQVATIEWLYACVLQNAVVSLEGYRPKESLAGDAGALSATQCPSQAARLAAGEIGSQWTTQSNREGISMSGKGKVLGGKKRKPEAVAVRNRVARSNQIEKAGFDPWDELTASWSSNDLSLSVKGKDDKLNSQTERGAQLPGTTKEQLDGHKELAGNMIGGDDQSRMLNMQELVQLEAVVEIESPQPDVAAAIENLLAQTSKANHGDNLSKEEEDDPDLLFESAIRSRGDLHPQPSKASRSYEHEGEPKVLSDTSVQYGFDRFEDSQLDSQVVAYDEDHSGRQMIMERVRTRDVPASANGNGVFRRDQRNTHLKSSGLGRLFKAAEANK